MEGPKTGSITGADRGARSQQLLRLFIWEGDHCRDSTEAGSNLLKLSVTDGFFWRSEVPLVTVIGPLSDPRPLPCKPLPFRSFCPAQSACSPAHLRCRADLPHRRRPGHANHLLFGVSAAVRKTLKARINQRWSTSTMALAKACGASCGRLWPTPPVMRRYSYLPENLSRYAALDV
jgi:hypothetical protein